jgi:exodeoxyribonuclease VII small subunit
MSTKKAKTPDFETALKELETILQRMESGKLSLEESLKVFERGVELTRFCEQALSDAEQKVKILTEQGQEKTFTATQGEDD